MPNSVNDDVFEAILFLQNQYISRQMRYSEFEEMLDRIVPLFDFADSEVTAVYVEMSAELKPTALVFFKIYFDKGGRPDAEWNVPLRRLANMSGSGPDLGGGPVKLACRSQCPISWHQRDLWNPDASPGGSDFQLIKRAIAEDKLKFKEKNQLFMMDEGDDDDNIPLLTTTVEATEEAFDGIGFFEEQERLQVNKHEHLLSTQKQRIKALTEQHGAEITQVNRKNQAEIQNYKSKMKSHEQAVQQHKNITEKAKSKLQKMNNQILSLQEDITTYRKKLSILNKELTKSLPAKVFEDLKERLEAEINDLQEELDQRDKKEERFKAEFAMLKSRVDIAESGDILKRMAELNVVFVVHHIGAGHMTLSLKDVRAFMANKTAFIAERCGVVEENFKLWMKHYNSPNCDICKKIITRVSIPAEFLPGRSNRCENHQIN